MPSKKPYIHVRTEIETIELFKTIAYAEGKSMSVLAEQLVKEYIEKFYHEKSTNENN